MDYHFLAQYIIHEIQRLERSAKVLRLHREGYAYDLKREGNSGRSAVRSERLIEETDLKLGLLEPQIKKLKEQLPELIALGQ